MSAKAQPEKEWSFQVSQFTFDLEGSKQQQEDHLKIIKSVVKNDLQNTFQKRIVRILDSREEAASPQIASVLRRNSKQQIESLNSNNSIRKEDEIPSICPVFGQQQLPFKSELVKRTFAQFTIETDIPSYNPKLFLKQNKKLAEALPAIEKQIISRTNQFEKLQQKSMKKRVELMKVKLYNHAKRVQSNLLQQSMKNTVQMKRDLVGLGNQQAQFSIASEKPSNLIEAYRFEVCPERHLQYIAKVQANSKGENLGHKIIYPKYENLISSLQLPPINRKIQFIPFFQTISLHEEIENDKMKYFTFKVKELQRFVIKVIDYLYDNKHNYVSLAKSMNLPAEFIKFLYDSVSKIFRFSQLGRNVRKRTQSQTAQIKELKAEIKKLFQKIVKYLDFNSLQESFPKEETFLSIDQFIALLRILDNQEEEEEQDDVNEKKENKFLQLRI